MTTTPEVKLAPNSKESEMMVLGCMLTSINALNIAADGLDDSDFYYTEHKIVFQALKNTYKSDKPADVHLICEELKRTDKLKAVGGAAYIMTLAQYAGTSAHIEEYVAIVRNKAILRNMIHVAQKLERRALENPDDLSGLLEDAQSSLKKIADNKSINGYEQFTENNSEEKLIDDLKNISCGVSTGFTIGEIDWVIPGGGITVIALPTGHGKTTLLINTALGVLKHHHDKSVYFFSYEESGASILTYFLNTFIGKDISRDCRGSIQSYFRDGTDQFIKKDYKDEFARGKETFFTHLIDNGRLRVFYTDMYIEELIAAIRFIKKNTNVGLICIDYIQCLRLLRQFQGSRQEQIKEISHMLKDVAVDTGLPIILGAQFNRQVLCEADLSPTNIREAADIEQISKVVIGGWNRNYNGFSSEGNKMKDGKKAPIEFAIYLEILKGREIGNGHNSVFDFNGNSGILTNRINQHKQNTKPLF